MTSESNAITLAQSAFEAVCKERDEALAKLSTVHCWVEKNLSGGFIDSLTHLQNLECVADDWYGRLVETIRERDEARRNAEVERLSGIAVVKLCSRLESERDEAREELQQWKMLYAWGGTPEHIDQFIKGQQSRIHEAQEIELVCEQLERERDEAREDAMNYYAKIGELERERDEARQELSALKAALRQRLEETK